MNSKFKKPGILMVLVLALSFVSCTKDENDSKATKATITVLDSNFQPLSGMPVYVYTKDTWNVIGDKPLFADKTVSADHDGNAVFLIDDIHMIFAIDTQEIIRFSVHYTLGGITKTKVTALTFSKRDKKLATLILD